MNELKRRFKRSVLHDTSRYFRNLPTHILWDLLTFVIILVLAALYYGFVTKIAVSLEPLQAFADMIQSTLASAAPGSLPDSTFLYSSLAKNKAIWYWFLFRTFAALLLMLVLGIFVESFTRILIYSGIKRHKDWLKSWKRFFFLHLMWFGSGVLLVVLSALIHPWLCLVIFLLLTLFYLYFTPILNILFNIKESYLRSMTETLKFGVKKIGHLLVHLVILLVASFILMFPLNILSASEVSIYIITVYLFAIISWSRVYYYLAIKKIGGKIV